jgi:thioredoxin-dependent peroxiredoxin
MRSIAFPVTSFLAAAVIAATAAVAAAGTPKAGDDAPRIEGTDQDGNAWKLTDRIGHEAVILYFYPKDETPGCTKEACGFPDRITGLKKLDVAVFGISRDDAESHRKFREKNNLNFPLLVDTDGRLTEAFGAGAPDKPRSRRVSFLIGRAGKVVHVTDNRDAQVHLDELTAAVEALRR